MEPAFYRGDILFLTNFAGAAYKTGDITVYKVPGSPIPIVHRVLEARDLAAAANASGLLPAAPLAQNQLLLTKGDNNPVDDLELYNGLEWLERQHIVGKVQACVAPPAVGASRLTRVQVPPVRRLRHDSHGTILPSSLLLRA
jgi:signal peptidase